MKLNLRNFEKFEQRHNGSNAAQTQAMLDFIKATSLSQLIDQTIPKSIQLKKPLNLPQAQTEQEFLASFKKIAQKNKIFKSYIGMGYYNNFTPNVILRNILENPAWYTAYTPYQAEIAQGRLEALINYQTMVIDLTGMEIANASLLDEGTAAAEAMTMLHAQRKGERKNANTFFVSELCFPQTIDVLKTRGTPIGINILVGDHTKIDLTDANIYGIMLQYPAGNGEVFDYSAQIATAKELGVFVAVASDLLALTLLTPPGEMGADVVVGSSQRMGVPMGYGGPHAAFFATKDEFKRHIPGRIIGVSLDAKGNKAYRMALQTREQHIRREKATSNICTAQVLLSVMAGMYGVYHGAKGLRAIGERVFGLTNLLKQSLQKLNFTIETQNHFDTLKIAVSDKSKVKEVAEKHEMNFRYFEDEKNISFIGISLDETTTVEDVENILKVLSMAESKEISFKISDLANEISLNLPENLLRKSAYMTHPVFSKYHIEHEMLRYMKLLENKDLSLVHSMIALGSCTMKLNATAEMMPVTWKEMGAIHPFVPLNQAQGYMEMCQNLTEWLKEITGFDAVSLQPNSGAQGEYAGLMAIRGYHLKNGDKHRNIALIPASAHGTNPASAVMAGMSVVVTKTDEKGNIDLVDLKEKVAQHKDNLSCLMVTYPSTHGVFEEAIQEICALIHANGGQVYMDGANMNAQVGLTSPANIGADVCHLNLHKTFCIPHGGGGPGMGPICVKAHLEPFLASHVVVDINKNNMGAVSAAPYGSASILAISYAYIAMMGGDGLTRATEMAILNANYIKERLNGHFDVLYTGSQGRAAHEMILDCRDFKKFGVEAEDLAKRLMDYGFHAPTLSFPVAGTLMIEPTESESKDELDRFCDAMIAVREEIREIENGKYPQDNNVLKNAPHTAVVALSSTWEYPYSREKAVYPLPYVKNAKFWPAVSRIDSAYGDRNLMCSCIPLEEYTQKEETTSAASAN